MADVTLQSFVIKIRHEIDQASAKRFSDAMHHGIAQITAFKLALVALGVGVAEVVSKTVSHFERLYFQTKLSGVAAKDILALEFAYKSVGLAASDTAGD